MRKIAPSDRLREELRAFLRSAGEAGDGGSALSELVRLATTLIAQEGLEAEQRDFIGRERYERGERHGWRSGYKPGRLDTAEGRIELDLPQVRGTDRPYRSRLFDFLRGDSEMLERLAVEMRARGLSTRDIEAAFTDENGVCLLSRTAASECCQSPPPLICARMKCTSGCRAASACPYSKSSSAAGLRNGTSRYASLSGLSWRTSA